ncbi:MAG: glycosyltransferase [Smithella sp.]|nr:glycosyltransferase [Smithella sp.]
MIHRPRYSVILPVCHGGEFLAEAVRSLTVLCSPGGGFEVIIVGEKEEMKHMAVFDFTGHGWSLVECGGNRSEILNAACAKARGDVWVFSDDDCIFPSDWLVKVEKSILDNQGVSVLGGTDFLASGASGLDVALDIVLNSWMGNGGIRYDKRLKAGAYYPKLWNMTVMADVARSAALGHPDSPQRIFDPSLFVHEDVDLTERMKARGGKVVYAPDACVLHRRDTTFVDFFKRNMEMARVCRQKGIHRFPHLFLAAALVGFPALIALSLVVPAFKILFIIYGIYIAAVAVTAIRGAVLKRRAVLIMLIPGLIVAMHIARVVGYIFASAGNFRTKCSAGRGPECPA